VAANQQLGNVTLTVIFPGKNNFIRDVQFTIIPGLNARVIIGLNVLRQMGLSIDNDVIKVAGHRVQMLNTVGMKINVSSFKKFFQPDSEPLTPPEEEREMKPTPSIANCKENFGNQSGCKPKSMEPTFPTLMQAELNQNRDLVESNIRELVDNSDLSNSGKVILRRILNKNEKIISKDEFDVGCYQTPVKLQLRQNCGDPIYVPCRRIPHALRPTLEDFLNKMEKSKIIEKIDGSSYNSPLFFVKKKNNKWRPVSDYRCLNKQLQSWSSPIPHLRDLLDKLDGSNFFTAIDLRSGFFNIMLDEESRQMTAFSVLNQTWQFNRLPQGIKVSPCIFQSIMTKIVDGIPQCLVYMDDLLIHHKTENGCLNTIEEVLKRFHTNGMKINLSKSTFCMKKIIYLGYEISAAGWRPTRSKIDAIVNMEAPKSTKDCRSFCGMLNYVSSQIPRLAQIMDPINKLTGKRKFDWNEECQTAFENAKKEMVKCVTLSFISRNPRDRLVVTSDASDTGWGGSLSQIRVSTDGSEEALGYTSGTWHDAETRWPICEKELSSFLRCLKRYDTYLVSRPFIWRTDNKTLSYLLTESLVKKTAMSTFTPKIARWLDYIGSFDFEIEHFNGQSPEMSITDYLSRSTSTKNEIQSLQHIDYNNIWMTSGITLSQLSKEQEDDTEVQNRSNGYKILKNSKMFEVEMKNGVLMAKKKGQPGYKLVIPNNLIHDTLSWTHSYNHRGITSMMKEIQKQFFIPNCTNAVREFIKNCEICLRKPKRKPDDIPIKQTSAKHPWSMVHMDLMGPMNESENGNKYILAMVDSLTRWTELRCIPSKHAQCVADACFSIFCSRGPPLSILCDNGREFKNNGLVIMMKNLGVHVQFSTPRRPETNGVVERTNQKVKRQLQNFEATKDNWEDIIPLVQLSINLQYNRNLNSSPFYSIHGWLLQRMEFLDSDKLEHMDITDYDSKSWSKYHSVRMAKLLGSLYMKDVERKTRRYENLKKNYGESKFANNEKQNNQIHTGAKVLIEYPQPPGEVGKLYNPWKGTYIVVKQVDRNTYLVGPEESRRRKFLVARKRMRVIQESNNPVQIGQELEGKAQCESQSKITADAFDDEEEGTRTKRVTSDLEPRKAKIPTHRMKTRSKTGKLVNSQN